MTDLIRKAGLCLIKAHKDEQAAAAIELCPPEQAATQYLNFLRAVERSEWRFSYIVSF